MHCTQLKAGQDLETRLRYEWVEPSGLALLERLHVELNSERSQGLSSTLSNLQYLTHTSTYRCGTPTRHDADNILSIWEEGVEGDCRLSWTFPSLDTLHWVGSCRSQSQVCICLCWIVETYITHTTPGAQQDIPYSTALNLTPQCCSAVYIVCLCWIMRHTQHTRCLAGYLAAAVQIYYYTFLW